jgi:hypothetical protein
MMDRVLVEHNTPFVAGQFKAPPRPSPPSGLGPDMRTVPAIERLASCPVAFAKRLSEAGIVPSPGACRSCSQQLRIQSAPSFADGAAFVCGRHGCRQRPISLKIGTPFENSKSALKIWAQTMVCYDADLTVSKVANPETSHSTTRFEPLSRRARTGEQDFGFAVQVDCLEVPRV